MPNLGQIWRFLEPCDLEIWRMTLKKQKGTSPKQHQALCIISSSFVISNWSYGPETIKLGCDLRDLDFWPLTLMFCMDITSVIDNNSNLYTCSK